MPIPQGTTQEPEPQEQGQPADRTQQQLRKASGQLRKVLAQRENLLELRAAQPTRTALSPAETQEEQLQRLLAQRQERGRRQKLQALGDRLLKLAGTLRPGPDDQRWLQETEERFQELAGREGLRQREEELSEQPLEDLLLERERGQPLPRVQQRMQEVGDRVQRVTSELERLPGQSAPGPPESLAAAVHRWQPPGAPDRAAAATAAATPPLGEARQAAVPGPPGTAPSPRRGNRRSL
ncbi:hypothetical protein [Streptomyces axinellae]|uniref:Uncharacterized protein n=1 Tax=Streptomyces axinellae TaxID=552788 RepID=A0ABP6CX43_9ACTN